MNRDSRFSRKPAHEPLEVSRPERNAPGRRRETRPGHMNKDRAAKAGNAGPGIVVDLDEQVIEPVIAPKPVAWFIGRPDEGAIVAPVARILAPGVRGTDAADGKGGARPREAIRPPPDPHRPKHPARRPAVTFALAGSHAAPPERDRNS